MSKRHASASSSQRTTNQNYYTPLQTVDDDDNDEIIIESAVKVAIPPITILKCQIEQVHEMCRILQVIDYSIRKISIGLKLFCTNKVDFDKICEALSQKFQYEYFTYASKTEKPYKAVLLGLDKYDPAVIKTRLLNLGLKCIDVKIVTRKSDSLREQVIYIVYFERKSITLRELKQNYSVINYIKVRWEYQKPNKSKLTQCYNCQMFGHGSSRCNVKPFCAQCAGNHKTAECSVNTIKCANCKGPHKAMSPECPSREIYKQIRQRTQPKSLRQKPEFNNRANYSNNFPNTLHQNSALPSTSRWNFTQPSSKPNNSGDSNLFSFEELKNLTFELITNLRGCKSREEQFQVVTNLACKFLLQ